MKLAIVGIRGLPNTYGGFETLADYLVKYLATELEITVFCSSVDMKSNSTTYMGANLEYISISSHGFKGIIYDNFALLKSINKFDKILLLGFGGGLLMPFFGINKRKIIVNIGGLDWKRDKWGLIGKTIIKSFEKLLLKNAGLIVSDNLMIKKYIKETYNRDSSLIAYGGDQSQQIEINPESIKTYPFLKNPYALSVARIQSDNQIVLLLETFKRYGKKHFVLVGNFKDSSFGIDILEKYKNIENISLVEAIYNRDILDMIRSNCDYYVHAHSAGGTNPALVEAMHLSLPIFAYANGYNEHTTGNLALYFKKQEDLIKLIEQENELDLKIMGESLYKKAISDYCWSDITEKYKKLFLDEG
ncbi:MAG: DUF1972 domain-containing protein [Pelobium sp.]